MPINQVSHAAELSIVMALAGADRIFNTDWTEVSEVDDGYVTLSTMQKKKTAKSVETVQERNRHVGMEACTIRQTVQLTYKET